MTQGLVLLHAKQSAMKPPHFPVGADASPEIKGADSKCCSVRSTCFAFATDMACDPIKPYCADEAPREELSPPGDSASMDLVLENLNVAPDN